MQPSAAQTPAQPIPPDGHAPVLEARLVHAEPGRRVVEVSAWLRGACLGRSLGEGGDAEDAETRAIERLLQRLNQPAALASPPRPTAPRPTAAAPTRPARAASTAPRSTPDPPTDGAGLEESINAPEPAAPAGLTISSPSSTASAPDGPSADEPAPDPEDWSEELAELDVQLQRLGWDRSQESTYLQRVFGHPSRNRLTAYADLVAYLRTLRSLNQGSQPDTAPVPLRRRDLLAQSDELLASLGWDAGRGRDLLERQFRLTSRQQLSDEQLLEFNMLLEGELMTVGSAP
jgi:hypothetical protein